jgi:hypothetical protein
MVRRTRIVAATAAALAGLLSGALAPAAGDQRVTGSAGDRVSFTDDGIPYVNSGLECKAGTAAKGERRHSSNAHASDF